MKYQFGCNTKIHDDNNKAQKICVVRALKIDFLQTFIVFNFINRVSRHRYNILPKQQSQPCIVFIVYTTFFRWFCFIHWSGKLTISAMNKIKYKFSWCRKYLFCAVSLSLKSQLDVSSVVWFKLYYKHSRNHILVIENGIHIRNMVC